MEPSLLQTAYGEAASFLTHWYALLLQNVSEFHICTTVSFFNILLIYFVCAFPYWVIDYFGIFVRYKIQKDVGYNREKVMACLKVLVFNHLALALPLIYASYPILTFRGVEFGLPLPSLWDVMWRIPVYFLLEDFWFYWGHRFLHTPWMYNHIHKMHHRFNTPIGMASSYAHPVEFLFLGVGTFLGPVIIGGGHIVGVWVWSFFRQLEAIECHCGYDFPWSLSKFLPFYCGPAHHDFHHYSYDGNYASTFTWCDRLFGTDKGYQKFCQRGGHAKRKAPRIEEHQIYAGNQKLIDQNKED